MNKEFRGLNEVWWLYAAMLAHCGKKHAVQIAALAGVGNFVSLLLGNDAEAQKSAAKRAVLVSQSYDAAGLVISGLDNPNLVNIGSGLSAFNFNFLEENPRKKVFDIDRAGLSQFKSQVFDDLAERTSRNSNSFIQCVGLKDVRELADPSMVKIFVDAMDGPVTFLTDFVLTWLSPEEKLALAWFIHAVLSRNGGSWVSLDVMDRQMLEYILATDPQFKKVYEKVVEVIGIDPRDRFFENDQSREKFFLQTGFTKIESQSVTKLVNDPSEEVEDGVAEIVARSASSKIMTVGL